MSNGTKFYNCVVLNRTKTERARDVKAPNVL